MTEYFEVHERDGAARIGELRLTESLTTPAVADEVINDAGSHWPAERGVPDGDESVLTILPHRGLPSGTPEDVQDTFAVDYSDCDVETPSAAVVSPETATDHGTDAYVLANASGYVGHARDFVDAIVRTRESIPADTALFLSGVATPANVSTLVYAGVDLVDTTRAVVRGTEGRYLTTDDAYFLEDLDELPCVCPACQQPRETFDREDCIEHNVNALEAELGRVRRRIRDGRLRDYIEGQARHEQWLTATFRRLDQQYSYQEQRTPIIRQADITAASDDTIRRVEIQRFAKRVTEQYHNRFDNPLVLVPCSARKPYSESQSHSQYHDAIQWRGHVVSMTSPIGVVPQELETTYPAQQYDSVVTGEWTETEIEFVSTVLSAYLTRNEYPKVIAHIPPEGYREIVERATAELDIDPVYTVTDHPTTADSLANLASELEGKSKYAKREREHNTIRAIADYQFGGHAESATPDTTVNTDVKAAPTGDTDADADAHAHTTRSGRGAGDELFEDIQTESRYPKLRVHESDGEQLAAMVPNYGVLSLTLAGGRRWVESAVPTKRVEIDDFVPHGSVLAPGVTDATDGIRPGDEVIIDGPSAFGVGRALMSGPEMIESTRGIASEVRHVAEL